MQLNFQLKIFMDLGVRYESYKLAATLKIGQLACPVKFATAMVNHDFVMSPKVTGGCDQLQRSMVVNSTAPFVILYAVEDGSKIRKLLETLKNGRNPYRFDICPLQLPVHLPMSKTSLSV